MLHIKKQRFKKKIALLLASVSLVTSTLIAPTATYAGDFTGGAGLKVTIESLKVTSSPVEEENDFTVQAKYHAEYTNYGWDETVWSTCDTCGGSGGSGVCTRSTYIRVVANLHSYSDNHILLLYMSSKKDISIEFKCVKTRV